MLSLRDYAGESMTLVVERDLLCTPARAFAAVTEPELMNHWSTAPIRSARNGDGGLASGTGALREVRLPGPRPLRLREVVLESSPPHRFVYSVYGGAPIRAHRGTMELSPTATGTHFRWTIELTFPVPGMGAVARRAFERELHRSLDRLVEVAPTLPERALPPARNMDETRELSALTVAAQASAEAQRVMADRLDAEGDPRAWFTRVYQYVTEGQLAAVAAGSFSHPGWVLRLIPAFHHYYVDALHPFLEGRMAEAHWQAAFAAMEKRRAGEGQFHALARGVFQGMRAHIEEDLPRALATVYAAYYRDRCDFARFRGDYYRMAPIFDDAGEQLVTRVKLPWSTRVSRAVLPREVLAHLMARDYYDIPRRRREAFERGERLAVLTAKTP